MSQDFESNEERVLRVKTIMDRVFDKEMKKDRRRKALEKTRREIRKIARRVNNPDLYNL